MRFGDLLAAYERHFPRQGPTAREVLEHQRQLDEDTKPVVPHTCEGCQSTRESK